MPRLIPAVLSQELTNWHDAYQSWTHDNFIRTLVRNDHGGIYSYNRRERIPVHVTRGSIEELYYDARGRPTGAGHWYSFFREGRTLFLYDPSYPIGPYYQHGADQRILSHVRTMNGGRSVQFYTPFRTPLQIHHKDAFCQTWSMIAIASGQDHNGVSWQTRQQDLEADFYDTDDEMAIANQRRLDLLFDFVRYWLNKDSHPTAVRLLNRFEQLRSRWEHYYMTRDYAGGRHLEATFDELH